MSFMMSPPGSPLFETPLSVCLLFTGSQSSRGGLFFDFERKRDILKNIMPEGCMPDDQWLHSILKANGFDVQRTAEALLEIQGAQQSALPSSLEPPLEPMQMDRAEGLKRARVELSPPPTTATFRPMAAPFTQAAAASAARSQTASMTPMEDSETGRMDPGTASLLTLMNTLVKQLEKLPAQLAASVPEAVRKYDTEEANRVRRHAVESDLGGVVSLIRAAHDMASLARVEGATFRWNPHENTITCIVCECYADASGIRNAVAAGKIQGPDLTRHESTGDRPTGRQYRPFAVVQEMCIRHLAGDVHCWCVVKDASERKKASERDAAALLCGRIGLQNIIEHDSDASYERRIAAVRVANVNVGTKNHSKAFIPMLRRSCATVLYSGFTRLLTATQVATGRPPPIAVMADKATVQRQTGQMHGIILMAEGVLVALFVSVAVAPDPSGAGLATLLETMLMGGQPLSLSIDLLRQSLTCAAFDGQYQGAHEGHAAGLDVLSHFCKKLKLNSKFLLSRWDKAHLIELGMDEARKETRWYSELAGQVSETQTKYLHGKGFDRVREAFSAFQRKMKPAAIGVVCTTRFAHSERKVYKNFFRNLVVFITDKRKLVADQVADHVEIARNVDLISSVLFVVRLAGLIDLLQMVKNLSLVMQKVNTLPWEVEDTIKSTCELLEQLSTDLKKGDVTRTLPPTERSQGNRVPAFEFLSANMADFKQCKLSLRDPREESNSSPLQTVQLTLSSARRASRGSDAFRVMGRAAAAVAGAVGIGSSDDPETKAEIDAALLDLSKLAALMALVLSRRLRDPDDEARKIMCMARCLDLRKMAFDDGYATLEAVPREPLRRLYAWLATRFQDSSGAPLSAELNDMPPFDAVWQQWLRLRERLRAASSQAPFKVRWTGASGSVIMKDVFTNERFYPDCLDFLYLFQHCATKSMCEAVVEGMGGCWDKSSPADRHPSFEAGDEQRTHNLAMQTSII